LFVISLAQGAISYSMTVGALRGVLSSDVSLLTKGLNILRFGVVTVLGVLWLFKLKHALFQSIILVVHVGTAGPHERAHCRPVRVRLAGGPHASARRRVDGGIEHLDLFNLVLAY